MQSLYFQAFTIKMTQSEDDAIETGREKDSGRDFWHDDCNKYYYGTAAVSARENFGFRIN